MPLSKKMEKMDPENASKNAPYQELYPGLESINASLDALQALGEVAGGAFPGQLTSVT